MYLIRQTDAFRKWFSALRDARAKARILVRLDSARLGNFGDAKNLGGGLNELRVDVGAGYRLYFTRQGRTVILLLCGGDKSSQSRDIQRARKLAREFETD